jgi:hypothetical protein
MNTNKKIALSTARLDFEALRSTAEQIKTFHVFGFITQPLNGNGFGIAVADNFKGGGKPRSFSLTNKTGPHAVMESGARKPQFAESLIERRPDAIDGVVLEVYRGTSGVHRVKRWGFQSDWDKVLLTIKNSPRDHMSRSERFMARFERGAQAVAAGMNGAIRSLVPKAEAPGIQKLRRVGERQLFLKPDPLQPSQTRHGNVAGFLFALFL